MSEDAFPNPSTALARVVLDELVRNGLRQIVVAPGSRSAPLALAAADREDVRLHVELDERSAGFLALGLGRAGAGPAAVITTSGSAVANLHPAVVEADLGAVPLLLLTADRPPELHHVGANQTIEQEGIFGSAVRWSVRLGPPEDRPGEPASWRSTVCRAMAEAAGRGRPPGPVHLDLAFREPLVPASDDGRTTAEPYRARTAGRAGGAPWTASRARPPAVVELGARWTGVERGLVVAGDMPGVPDVAAIADRLSARLGWPLVTEPASGGRPSQSISTVHHLAGHPGFAARHRPDAVLVLGRIGLSRALQALLDGVPRVVADPFGWPDPDRQGVELLSGIPVVVDPDLPGREASSWRRAWLDAERVARNAIDRRLDRESTPTEPRLARDVGRAMVAGDVLVVGSSMPVRDVDMFLAPGPFSIVSNRGASGIDGFVSTALGVGCREQEGSVVALGGDLSVLHDANGFLLAERPDTVFVVASNDGGGIFSFLPQAGFPEHFERVFGTPHGRSFERLAAFHGLGFRRIEAADEVVAAIEDCTEEGGVQLVEVPTDRAANVEFHRSVTADVHAALDRDLG